MLTLLYVYVVAVKTLHAEDNLASQTELMAEAAFMAQLNSEFIIKLVGVCTLGGSMMMIMEYCEHGALHEFLRGDDFELPLKLLILNDIARGCAYLESLGVIHRDLASRNVLLSSTWRGRIADFGMVRKCCLS